MSNSLCYLQSNHDVNAQRNLHLLASSSLLHRNYCRADLHQYFTRYSGISGAIKSCIYKTLVHSVSECHAEQRKWGVCPFFTKLLAKSENKVQIHYLHPSTALSCGEKIARKRSSTSGDIWQNTPVFWPCCTRRSQMSSVNSGVTGPNFTKFAHDIEALFVLLMRKWCLYIIWKFREIRSSNSKFDRTHCDTTNKTGIFC